MTSEHCPRCEGAELLKPAPTTVCKFCKRVEFAGNTQLLQQLPDAPEYCHRAMVERLGTNSRAQAEQCFRLAFERAQAEVQALRRERNEARNHLDGMTRSRDAARTEIRGMVESFKQLTATLKRARTLLQKLLSEEHHPCACTEDAECLEPEVSDCPRKAARAFLAGAVSPPEAAAEVRATRLRAALAALFATDQPLEALRGEHPCGCGTDAECLEPEVPQCPNKRARAGKS